MMNLSFVRAACGARDAQSDLTTDIDEWHVELRRIEPGFQRWILNLPRHANHSIPLFSEAKGLADRISGLATVPVACSLP